MPRIRCHYDDCVFLEDGYCGAASVEVEPDMGCVTYSRNEEEAAEEEWEEDELDEFEEEDEDLYEEDDEETWDEDEEEDY